MARHVHDQFAVRERPMLAQLALMVARIAVPVLVFASLAIRDEAHRTQFAAERIGCGIAVAQHVLVEILSRVVGLAARVTLERSHVPMPLLVVQQRRFADEALRALVARERILGHAGMMVPVFVQLFAQVERALTARMRTDET